MRISENRPTGNVCYNQEFSVIILPNIYIYIYDSTIMMNIAYGGYLVLFRQTNNLKTYNTLALDRPLTVVCWKVAMLKGATESCRFTIEHIYSSTLLKLHLPSINFRKTVSLFLFRYTTCSANIMCSWLLWKQGLARRMSGRGTSSSRG